MKNNRKELLKVATVAIIGCGVVAVKAWAYDENECRYALIGYEQCAPAWGNCDWAATVDYNTCVANCVSNGGNQADCAAGDCDSAYAVDQDICDSDRMDCEDEWQNEIDYWCC